MTAPEVELQELELVGDGVRGAFNARQVHQLLQPIHSSRVVASDGKGNAHLSQQDVTAHLTRIFGFGHFDTEVVSLDLLFEHNRPTDAGKPSNRWDVGYRAVVRLTVRDEHGREVCHFEDGSTGTAENQKLGDGHDLAMKSALSLAKKRCAVNLGDQFGLSLYNKGQRSALVIATLVRPAVPEQRTDVEPEDVQDDVPQQVASGNTEDPELPAPPDTDARRVSAADITGGKS